jgi:hypothetical protein
MIALHKKMNPWRAVIGHIIIALITVLLSNFLGKWVVDKLHY